MEAEKSLKNSENVNSDVQVASKLENFELPKMARIARVFYIASCVVSVIGIIIMIFEGIFNGGDSGDALTPFAFTIIAVSAIDIVLLIIFLFTSFAYTGKKKTKTPSFSEAQE